MQEPVSRADYVRHTIALAGSSDLDRVRASLGLLPDRVIVNIVDAATSQAVAFCEEHLRTALAASPSALLVETLPFDTYRRVMTYKIDQVSRESVALRTILCGRPIEDVRDEASAVIRHVDQLLSLLQGYALQSTEPSVWEHVRRFEAVRHELVRSCLAGSDNVRCMDNLHYEMGPSLAAFAALFAG